MSRAISAKQHTLPEEPAQNLDMKATDDLAFFENLFSEIEAAGSLFKMPHRDSETCIDSSLALDEEELRAFLTVRNLPTPHFFCAAFGYVLSCFTGSAITQFCLAQNNATDRQSDANTQLVPLLFDCSDTSVDEYLEQASKTIAEVLAHASYPLASLVERFHLNPNITFEYRSDASAELASSNIKPDGFALVVKKTGSSSFALSLRAGTDYSPSLCRGLLESYVLILREMLACQQLSDITITEDSVLEALDQANQTETELFHSDILEAFALSVSRYPQHIFLRFKDAAYTYSQSAQIALGISRALEDRGIVPGSHIAILVPRSEWCLFGALGVLTHGSAYVPCDDSYPDNRISFMLSDTDAKAVLVTNSTKQQAERLVSEMENPLQIINLDEAMEQIADGSKICSACVSEATSSAEAMSANSAYSYYPAKPTDTAFIVYTSGTTGNPKAIQITRIGVLNCAEWYATFTKMSCDDVYALYSAFTFDMHMVGFYPSAICGASIDIIPSEIRLDLDALNKRFCLTGATHTYLPTQIGRVFVNRCFSNSIRFLLVIGEKLGPFHAPEGIGMCESYGPTETLTFTTAIMVNDRICSSSIGRPIANTKAYVLDASGRRIPPGAVGELFLSTKQISKGYLNRDTENKAAFLPNPFDNTIPGYETMYRTGDVVTILPDLTIGFIGRKDSQVKIRGNRVELAEVESSIREMDSIKDVTATTMELNGNKELVVFVVPTTPAAPADAIRQQVSAHVAANKPSYMIPSFVELMDRIPLNVNGKVDKHALPLPTRAPISTNIVKPSSFLEANVLRCVCEVLDLEENAVGVNTDLSRCGLDSLSAINLSVLCQQRCNVDCSAFDILTHPSIEEFLQYRSREGYRPVHVLADNPNTKKLIFVHTRNDASVTYLKLAQSFTDGLTFACMDNYNLHHIDNRIRGYKTMASLYVDYLCSYQKEGPYYLGGWSLGGCIAYEMAAILQARGHKVEKVYLLDSEHFVNDLSLEEKQEYASLYVKNFFRSKWPKKITRVFDSHLMEGYQQEYHGQMLDSLNYEPSPYDGKVVYFKSTIQTLEEEDSVELNPAEAAAFRSYQERICSDSRREANGFEHFASNMNIIQIPFHHDNLMTDIAPAKMIAAEIERDMGTG